ncbi:MAG: hypothetical protein O7C63_08265, partial [Alphaproteobacteria bacterium]|nr:hypothetical protein [Alphaproteobacteria bacterium]
DHTDGLAELMQLRWHFNSKGPKVDVVCADDAPSPAGFTMSCRNLTAHIGDAFIESGEIAQRILENKVRLPGGPADLITVMPFAPGDTPGEVWSKDEVKVTAIGSTHVVGHVSYRVDTPAGSVLIGGDAGNDTLKPPRETSTSAQVELLAKDVDVIVHSTIHPVMGSDKDSGFPPPVYFRQSNAADLGAMAMRVGAKHLMLTHLIPPVGAPQQGPYKIPGGALTEADYRDAVESGGFSGNVIVGSDLATLRLPAQ